MPPAVALIGGVGGREGLINYQESEKRGWEDCASLTASYHLIMFLAVLKGLGGHRAEKKGG